MQVPYTVVAYILLGHIHFVSLPKCTTHSTPLVFETQETLELALPLTSHRRLLDIGEKFNIQQFFSRSMLCCPQCEVPFLLRLLLSLNQMKDFKNSCS